MRQLARGRWAFGAAIVLIACAAPPTTGGTAGLSIAYLDTRGLPDGDHLLRAEAVVAGTEVAREISVRVDNDLTDAAAVGTAGGSLRTASGSIASLPPGALARNARVSVRDATQEGILEEFGVNYPALGVTFLGALMFASDAEATSTGSVITRPVPRSEVIGFGAAGGLATLHASGVRPGRIVTVSARGFNPLASLANAARYGPTSAPTAETLLDVRAADTAAFDPLLEVRFAVPALGAGSHAVRLHNLTTGYRAEPVTVGLLAPGSAPATTWTGFVAQLEAAAERLTLGRADLAALAAGWRVALAVTDPVLPAAMAANSGLVSAANLAALQQIAAGGATAAQRDLVIRHALVPDAIASSLTGTPAAAAADLATLLVVTAHASRAGTSALNLLQAGAGTSCTGTASTGTGISWGSPGAPTTTGMGDGPPASCANGNLVGGSGGAASALDLGPAELATSSLRRGGFRPVAGALVKVFRPGTDVALAPFTAITDATGTFKIPFVAPGEPFTVRALDPVTLQVAVADGVARAVGFSTPVSLMFTSTAQGPGAPTASFVIRPVPDARFAGTVYCEFDASGSSDDGTIASYVWDFGGFLAEVEWTDTVVRGYGRNGTYDIRLTVIGDDGLAGTTTRLLVIDDLPHDYWGLAPELITVGPNGEILDDTALWTNLALSRDGRYAAFATTATNLDPADVNALPDVYLKDMETGAVELVSSGAANEAVGSFVALSADARYVAYGAATSQINPRIEIVDRQAGTTEIVLPAGGLSRITLIALSDDGRVVLFESSALSGPPRHLYVKDLDTDVLTRVGLELDGTTFAAQATGLGLSGDGDTVVFRSTSGALVPGDTNGVEDLFAYRRSTGATVRVNEAADGTQADRGSRARGRFVTPDGRFVTFWSEATTFPRSTENDGPGPFDQVEDVYVKDLVTGALTLVSTNAAGVIADDVAVLPTISDDGRYVGFYSRATNLAEGDVDGSVAYYYRAVNPLWAP